MKKIAIPVLLLLLTTLFFSCTKDNAKEYYGEIECDTLNVSYSATIHPILDRNCIACHGAGNGTGVNLSTYSGVKNEVDNGRLMGALRHDAGYSPMPQGGNKLDDCSISKFEAWIDLGAPND